MRTKRVVPGVDIGTRVFEKIKTCKSATFDIVEMCGAVDLKEKEAFYLDKYKDDANMVSSELIGAWVPVLQYKEDGNFVKKHFSIGAAARYNGVRASIIDRILNGERKMHKGMIFIHEKDYHARRKNIIKSRHKIREKKNGRMIQMVDDRGVPIKVFKKIAEAAREVGCCSSNIRRVLDGFQVKAKGYGFKWLPRPSAQ